MSKHLSLNDRIQIQTGLETEKNLSQIARELGKAETTVAREIKSHETFVDKGAYGRIKNRCVHRADCTVYGLCTDKPNCTRKCSTCHLCNGLCHDYEQEKCPQLMQPPYVCNGCRDKATCVLAKWVYDPKYAQDEYRSVLHEARQGFNLNSDELNIIDCCISPLIKQGQSIHHICVHNPDSIYVSERTVERLLNSCALSARSIDRPRACKLKPRKCHRTTVKIERDCRKGRTIQDFYRYCEENRIVSAVQMDSVEGRVGGKVLLTLIFPQSELMLAFLRDRNTSQTAIDCIEMLYVGLGREDFCKLFPVILTDNGSEFSHPSAFETAPDGFRRTNIFYCDPMASYQKPQVERNHEFIRQILPHGVSLDSLSQDGIALMMSHINSYGRPGLSDKSPFEMSAFLYGDALLDRLLHLLCLRVIPANEITLRPSLLER